MFRVKIPLSYALIVLAVLASFAVFISFRNNTALIGALSAAGTVAAAVFAAVAATASVRAAAQSNATASRSHEALARTAQPRIQPSIVAGDGALLGRIQIPQGNTAVDLIMAWVLTNGDTVADQLPSLASGIEHTIDLKLPATANAREELNMVWIEYWDESRVGQWQDTWLIKPDGPELFVRSESRLVG